MNPKPPRPSGQPVGPAPSTPIAAKPVLKKPAPKPIPWGLYILGVLLLASLYVFWVLPRQLPPPRVEVTFEPKAP